MAHDTIFGISAEFLRIRHISRIVALTAHDDSANLPNLLEFGTFAESRRDGTTMTRTRAFLAILGDVVGSRQIADRDKLRRDLKTALQRFRSPGVAGAIAGLPEITAGDEFQILLGMEPPSTNLPGFAAMEFLKHMTQSIRPAEITFGLGLGALGTELGAPVRELDGPCFHLARNALQVSKKEGRWAAVDGMPHPLGFAANALLRLAGEIRAGWTDRQFEIVRQRQRQPFQPQKDLAQQMAVSPSVISEVLRAARLDAVQEAEEAVRRLIDKAADPGNFPEWDTLAP